MPSLDQWLLVALGLVVLVVAFGAAADPYRQIREFREAVTCDQGGGNCLDTEPGSIIDRRTYDTAEVDGNGNVDVNFHYEVTWQQADGSRETREVMRSFYDKAQLGQPATSRLWHGELVDVQVLDETLRFLPEPGRTLDNWLYLAYFGLGVMLWGLLFGWWDGFFTLVVRTFAWMLMSFMPVRMLTGSLAFGFDTSTDFFIDQIVVCVFLMGFGGCLLYGSFELGKAMRDVN